MAVRYITNLQYLQGTSDEKEAELAGAAFGAEYFEEDTGKTYKKVASLRTATGAYWRLTSLGLVASEITKYDPLPVAVQTTQLVEPIQTPFIAIPGAAATLHANGDAIGTRFEISVPRSGTIRTALLVDLAKQSLQVDLIVYREVFTSGVDDSVFAPVDADKRKFGTPMPITTFYDFSTSSLGVAHLDIDYVAPDRVLYIQAVARGAITISALEDYWVSLIIANAKA